MPRPSVREQLIDAASHQFHENGFNGSGVQDITTAAGVPKGSFYNHFPSKESLAVEVLHRYAADRKLNMLTDSALAPVPRLRAHFEYLADDLERFQFTRGCMFGNFGSELSTQSAAIRTQVDEGLDRWAAAIAQVLDEVGASGSLVGGLDTGTLARFLVGAWEGAALRAKVTQSRSPLDDFFVVLDALLA